ncbi:MAG: hypothetical protein AB8H12_03450 [Lewinella sp.]
MSNSGMNGFPSNDFQRSFFQELEGRFVKRGDMVNELRKTLNVGRDAVYRRLRGDTSLSADELMVLASKYDIRLDADQAGPKPMDFPEELYHITSEVTYFRQVEQQITGIASLKGATMDYATPELPIFYELLAPTLLAFKTYVYGLTSWNFAKWKGVEFRPQLIDPEVFEIAQRILPYFCKIETRELWSVGILDVTLRQIEHAVDVGRLVDHKLIERMFLEVEVIISHMEAMTKSGKRFLPGTMPTDEDPDFCVYHNEMTNTNNVVIVKSPEHSFVISTLVNPDYIVSTDERVQRKMEIWFDNLIENSDALIADSGKYKERYFSQLRRFAAGTKQRIEGRLFERPGILS